MSGMNPETKRWRTTARKAGWRITKRGPHERWYSPDGKSIATISTTHEAPHCHLNTRAQLRRAGLPI